MYTAWCHALVHSRKRDMLFTKDTYSDTYIIQIHRENHNSTVFLSIPRQRSARGASTYNQEQRTCGRDATTHAGSVPLLTEKRIERNATHSSVTVTSTSLSRFFSAPPIRSATVEGEPEAGDTGSEQLYESATGPATSSISSAARIFATRESSDTTMYPVSCQKSQSRIRKCAYSACQNAQTDHGNSRTI